MSDQEYKQLLRLRQQLQRAEESFAAKYGGVSMHAVSSSHPDSVRAPATRARSGKGCDGRSNSRQCGSGTGPESVVTRAATRQPDRSNDEHHHAMKRAKTANVQSAAQSQKPSSVSMGRSKSSRSTMPSNKVNNPFTGIQPITPPVPPRDLSFANHATSPVNWEQSLARQPETGPFFTPDITPGSEVSGSTTQMNLSHIGMDVSQFLLAHSHDPATPGIDSYPQQYLSPGQSAHYNMRTAAVSTCDMLTDAPTLESPMSRQDSCAGQSSLYLSDPINMMRIGSQSSQLAAYSYGDLSAASDYSCQMPNSKVTYEQDVLGIGASLPSLMPLDFVSSASSIGYPSMEMERLSSTSSSGSAASASAQPQPTALCDDGNLYQSRSMERSGSNQSNASTKSTASLKLRAKDALARQNKNAISVNLAPKPTAAALAAAAAAATTAASAAAAAVNKDGSSAEGSSSSSSSCEVQDANKAAIPKSKYERRKNPKIPCPQCDEYPEGFRGEHELRRHTEAKHKGMVRKWVCQDPATVGISSSVQAVNPLSQCKQCLNKKQYGAYYNAAAHLRRAHFKLKPARGIQPSKASDRLPDDKRRGKGGGDWPLMSELKKWMTEVHVKLSDDEPFEESGIAGFGVGHEGELDAAAFYMDAFTEATAMLGHDSGGSMSFNSQAYSPECVGMDQGATPASFSSNVLLSSDSFGDAASYSYGLLGAAAPTAAQAMSLRDQYPSTISRNCNDYGGYAVAFSRA